MRGADAHVHPSVQVVDQESAVATHHQAVAQVEAGALSSGGGDLGGG